MQIPFYATNEIFVQAYFVERYLLRTAELNSGSNTPCLIED